MSKVKICDATIKTNGPENMLLFIISNHRRYSYLQGNDIDTAELT